MTYIDGPNDSILTRSSLGSSRTAIAHGKILRCRGCGFGFMTTRLSDEQLAELYRGLDDKVYEAEAKGRLRTASCHFKIVSQYVKSGRLVDVGCASGVFLQACATAGFGVVGVEPAEELCAKAQRALAGRAEVHRAVLQQASLAEASFDAVTLWDVLEHVDEPNSFMRLCASLLKQGGYLFANVPDLDSWQARLLGRRWPLLLPEHFNYFNRKSLAECGKKAGFQLQRFGRRPAFFSADYVLYRLAQHRVPGAALGRKLISASRMQKFLVPVFLGETYGVWRK